MALAAMSVVPELRAMKSCFMEMVFWGDANDSSVSSLTMKQTSLDWGHGSATIKGRLIDKICTVGQCVSGRLHHHKIAPRHSNGRVIRPENSSSINAYKPVATLLNGAHRLNELFE